MARLRRRFARELVTAVSTVAIVVLAYACSTVAAVVLSAER
jgi:hypothetical protein